jgi:hypothetical protein
MRAVIVIVIFGLLDFFATISIFGLVAFLPEFPIGYKWIAISNERLISVDLQADKKYRVSIVSDNSEGINFNAKAANVNFEFKNRENKDIDPKEVGRNFKKKIEGKLYKGIRLYEFTAPANGKLTIENNNIDFAKCFLLVDEDDSLKAIANLFVIFIFGSIIAVLGTMFIYKKWIKT